MEDGDDEFGDLYADVEVEASSAMNVALQFHQLSTETTETDNQKSVLEVIISDNKEDDIATDDFDDDDDDDDDDDLDIVLNSDDDDSSIKHGEGFTIGNNAKLRSGELEDEEDDNLVMEEFVVGKGGCGGGGGGGDGVNSQNLVGGGGKGVYNNSHSMYKYLRSNSTAYASDSKGSGCGVGEDNGYCQRMGSRSMGPGPQSGQRFSLPRARNILDVNIDIFEQKPWKHPGADITDYFNFGFNEDAWKVYCNQVDEYRHRSSGTPVLESAQLMETKAYGGGIEHEIVDGDACGKSETGQRKGQAIQVEDSIFERQSSMDVRRQLDRDSDAIQITILDPEENCSGSTKEGLSYLDGSSVPEASNHGDVSGDDGNDHLSFSSASEDESIEGNHLEMEIYALKRSSSRRSSNKPVKMGSENHGIHRISDVYGPQRSRMDISGSRGTDETIRTSDSSKAKKSPTNHYKAFEGGIDNPKSYSHDRLSVKPGYHHSEDSKREHDVRHANPVHSNRNHEDSHPRRLATKRKPSDCRYRARCNSPVYNNRIHMDSKLKPHLENDDLCSRKPDGEHRYHTRHRSPVYNRRSHEIDDSFPMSDIGGTYDVRSTVGHNRRNERLHSFDPYDEGNISPSGYYGERFYGYGDRNTSARDLEFRSLEEEEYYYGEERRYIEDDKLMARDWCHNERELAVEHVNFSSKRGAQWKWRDGLQFRNKDEYDECFLEREYSDDIQGEKFRSLAYYDRERDDFEGNYVKHVEYTRWEFRGPGRSKSAAGIPSSELNRPLRYKKGHSFTSRSSEESHINSERWHDNVTPRNNLYRRHGRYRAQWIGRFRYDGCSLDDPESDINDCVDMGRKRRHWQHEMKWKEDEVALRNNDAKPCVRFGKVSRRKSFVSEHEFDQIEESIDDPHIEGCKYKFRGSGDLLLVNDSNDVEEVLNELNADGCKYEERREVISGNKCSKTHGKSLEQPSLSCRNSLDSDSVLVVGEGKSADKAETNVAERIKPARMDFDSCPSDKAAVQAREGQVLTKEVKITKNDSGAHVNDVKGQNGKIGFDNSRILEAMAKMEKRRARFNEQITTAKNDSDSTNKPTVVDSVQQRPARKRRWGGS